MTTILIALGLLLLILVLIVVGVCLANAYDHPKAQLIGGGLLLLIVILPLLIVLLAGCTYNVTLTVSLPSDPTPAVTLDPQPQTKPDTNL